MKLIATGNTAEVFEYEEDKVLKLFKAGYPLEQIQREFNNTVIMNRTCVHTPKTFEIVEHEGRHGIVFQKIIGVDLLSEYLKNPSDEKVAAKILVDLSDIQKKVLLEETTEGISYKNYLDWFGYGAEKWKRILNLKIKSILLSTMNSVTWLAGVRFCRNRRKPFCQTAFVFLWNVKVKPLL